MAAAGFQLENKRCVVLSTTVTVLAPQVRPTKPSSQPSKEVDLNPESDPDNRLDCWQVAVTVGVQPLILEQGDLIPHWNMTLMWLFKVSLLLIVVVSLPWVQWPWPPFLAQCHTTQLWVLEQKSRLSEAQHFPQREVDISEENRSKHYLFCILT